MTFDHRTRWRLPCEPRRRFTWLRPSSIKRESFPRRSTRWARHPRRHHPRRPSSSTSPSLPHSKTSSSRSISTTWGRAVPSLRANCLGSGEVARAGLIQQSPRVGIRLGAVIVGYRDDLFHQVARLAHAQRPLAHPVLQDVPHAIERTRDAACLTLAAEQLNKLIRRRIVKPELESDPPQECVIRQVARLEVRGEY